MGSDSETVRPLLRAAEAPPSPEASASYLRYRSGRRLELRQGRLDELEVTSPDGRVELHVRFTPEGPVLSFEGARIDLTNARELNLRADRVRVRARECVDLSSDDEVVVRGRGNVSIDGENVLLNCDENPISG
ncbi:MAG: hypothetical protein R6X02_20215 [Enhygromyxa sp.]